MLAGHFKADPHIVPRLHWRLWVLALVLLIACPLIHHWQTHRERAMWKHHEQASAASEQRMHEQMAPIYTNHQAHYQRNDALRNWASRTNSQFVVRVVDSWIWSLPGVGYPSRRELENTLNNGVEFETIQVTRDWPGCACVGHTPSGRKVYEMAVHPAPDGGPPFYLHFSGDVLVHVEDSALPEFNRLWAAQACQSIHQEWQRLGPGLWLIMLVVPFMLRRHRVVLAELLTAVALLMVVSAGPDLAGLFQRGGWQSVSRDADVAWAMFMVSTSAAVLTWAMLRQSNASRILCSLCGYNLRGNTTGICPECGTKMPPELRDTLPSFP